jgi:hypothetical protein
MLRRQVVSARPTPTRISTRPRGSQASSIWSTLCANRYAKVGSHLAAQIARYKVGAEFRLRLSEADQKYSEQRTKNARAQRDILGPAVRPQPTLFVAPLVNNTASDVVSNAPARVNAVAVRTFRVIRESG